MNRKRLIQGNEAIADAAIAVGVRFFAGYPITPSSEIAETLAERLPRVGGRFIQMEDEIASMAAVIGASMTGVKSLTATSGPGFSLKQENLGYACMAETPCVVVNVQRGGPSSGLPTSPAQADVMQTRWGTHGDHELIVLCPSSVRECYTETVRAFNLSERFRVPVILLSDEIVAHMREGVVYPEEIEIVNRTQPAPGQTEYLPFKGGPDGVPLIANLGTGYRFHVTGLVHDETGFPSSDPSVVTSLLLRLKRKLADHLDEIVECDSVLLDDAEVCVLAYGATARSARQAVEMARSKGIKAGLLKLRTIWPFAVDEVRGIGQRMPVLVPEMNMGQLIHEVAGVTCCRAVPVNRFDGEMMTPDEILAGLEGM